MVEAAVVGGVLLIALPAFVGHTATEIAATTALSVAVVLMRRRWPVGAVALGLSCAVISSSVTGAPTVLLPACVVVLFHAAAATDRRTSLFLLLAGVAAGSACIVSIAPGDRLTPALLAAVAWPTLAVAAGDATRSRAEAIAAADERAERAEQSQEDEARRRVAEERLHLARELHDVVAHNVAVVNVQAGVAEHFLEHDADAARDALAQVRTSARAVLDELAAILGVLRADDHGADRSMPAPGIDDLPDLVAAFGGSGLDITLVTTGEARYLSPIASLAAYRTVQEALANALKHGSGAVRLCVAYEPNHVRIVAANPTADPVDGVPPGWGYGLTGMRERLTAAGGRLQVRNDGERFELVATVPCGAESFHQTVGCKP